jgi:hypothetical protein
LAVQFFPGGGFTSTLVRPPRLASLSRKIRASLPAVTIRCGYVLVPKGNATGAPDPKSTSRRFNWSALPGAKKSVAVSEPSALTDSRTTEFPRVRDGLLPGPALGLLPLPVLKKIWVPSDTKPPPLCQMPASAFQ